jgi:hypothetical protein
LIFIYIIINNNLVYLFTLLLKYGIISLLDVERFFSTRLDYT